MMSKKLTSRGRHTVLPIIGDTLVEIRLNMCSLPALVFKAVDGSEAEITIEDCISLRRGDQERLLEGSKPGTSFNPKELAPVLEVLGSAVTDAVAEREGLLRIAFENKLVLEVVPSHGYEAWHFHSPRPGRPAVTVTPGAGSADKADRIQVGKNVHVSESRKDTAHYEVVVA